MKGKVVKDKFICPHCHEEFEIKKHVVINVDEDAQLKKDVCNQDLFTYACPHCGTNSNIDYALWYEEPEKKLLVHLIDEEENVDQLIEQMDIDNPYSPFKAFYDNGYAIRLVESHDELVEKIAIFNFGYDDRIIELYKLMVWMRTTMENPNDDTYEVLFMPGEDKQCYIGIIHDHSLENGVLITEDIYNSIKNDYSPYFCDVYEERPVVNKERMLYLLTDINNDDNHNKMN